MTYYRAPSLCHCTDEVKDEVLWHRRDDVTALGNEHRGDGLQIILPEHFGVLWELIEDMCGWV